MTASHKLRVRLNAGSWQMGGVLATFADTVEMSMDTAVGVTSQRWEIYDYPVGFTVPAGWSSAVDAAGNTVYFSTAATPSSFTTHATLWGKYGLRLTVNGGVSEFIVGRTTQVGADPTLIDEATALSVPSASGLKGLMQRETNQFGGTDWTAAFNEDLRLVDTLTAGRFKEAVRVATTGNLVATRSGNVLTETGNGALASQDGVSLSVGNRILVRAQTTGADNGIYTVTSLGSAGTPYVLTRATDADVDAEIIPGMQVPVTEGTTYASATFQLATPSPITLNTTSLVFSILSTAVTGRLVSELRLQIASATVGSKVFLRGNTTPGDGAQGTLTIVSGGSYTDDGGTVFVAGGFGATESKAALRDFSGHLNVQWFGAKGDGVTNDTVAIERAFAALESSDSRALIFPPGTYIHTGMDIPSQASLLGLAGRGFNTLVGSSRLKYSGVGGTAYTIQNVVGTKIADLVLDGGGNDGNGTDGVGAAVVLSLEYLTSDCSFDRVTICGAVLNNIGVQTGGKLIDMPGTLEIDNLVFRRCNILQNPEDLADHAKYGVYNFNSNAFNITFEYCYFSSCDYLAYYSQGSCNIKHSQMFAWDSRAVWVGTVAQPFTLLDIYTEGTNAIFFEIFPSAGVHATTSIRLIDLQLNAECDIKTACTQKLILENVSTGGNLNVEPVSATYGIETVITHRCTFNPGKGLVGSGALTHVDRYQDFEGGVEVTRLRALRHPYSSDSGVLDAKAVVGPGTWWIPTLTAARTWTLAGGLVVQGPTGPAVSHTGTSISPRYQIRIQITTGGALGVGAFRWSLDNGATWEASGVTLPGGGTYALGSTGQTAVFAAGTYVLNEEYSWSTEPVSDGASMIVSRNAGTDDYALNVGGVVSLVAGEWAELEYDNSGGWKQMLRQAYPAGDTIQVSADTTTASATYVDCGVLTRTVSVRKNSRLFAQFDGIFQYVGAVGAHLGYFRLMLDGVAITGTERAPLVDDTTGVTNISISALTPALAVGNHTIKVQFHSDNAARTLGCYSGSAPTIFGAGLTVLERFA